MARNESNKDSGYKPLREHPFLMGTALGVLIGLGLALLVAVVVSPSRTATNKETVAAKSKPPEPPSANAPTAPPPAPETPPQAQQTQTAATSTGKPDDKKRVDVDKILQDNEERIREKDIKGTKAAGAAKETYYLQAGAFQNAADADNLKAKLAIEGLEASIQTAQLPPDNKVWHRVRLGPFKSVDEVGRAKAQLKQNQIEGTLIKVKDTVAQR